MIKKKKKKKEKQKAHVRYKATRYGGKEIFYYDMLCSIFYADQAILTPSFYFNYWYDCFKPEKWAVMNMCVKDIHFALF